MKWGRLPHASGPGWRGSSHSATSVRSYLKGISTWPSVAPSTSRWTQRTGSRCPPGFAPPSPTGWCSRAGPAPVSRSGRRPRTSAPPIVSPSSPHVLTILLDMTAIHVPVLAGELIEALDPRPGQTAIDCTVGGAGHARLVAERLGPGGTLIGIDRDPAAEEHFA